LDVGCGDGLIGLEALARVGSRGRVLFSDISETLLAQTRSAVAARGQLDRADFVVTDAEDLAQVADGSVDIATTRSVLIYVADKDRAFAALHRVLRPGGRISLFEPINRLMFPEPRHRFFGYDVREVAELADKVKSTLGELESGHVEAMMDFDDRDLVHLAEAAGFTRVHLECHIDVEPHSSTQAVSLHAFLESAPNPLAPTVGDSIAAALSAPERRRFVAHLGRAIEDARHIRRSAVAYLTASREA
jgi:arsenite methyltransferase